jgi:hypothetical protein
MKRCTEIATTCDDPTPSAPSVDMLPTHYKQALPDCHQLPDGKTTSLEHRSSPKKRQNCVPPDDAKFSCKRPKVADLQHTAPAMAFCSGSNLETHPEPEKLGNLYSLPPGIRTQIYQMVPSEKKFNCDNQCHWPPNLFNSSKAMRKDLGRCKYAVQHDKFTFTYDIGTAGSDAYLWTYERLAQTSTTTSFPYSLSADGQNISFAVVDSATGLPELRFQLLSEKLEQFELFLSMTNHRQMCEHGERMQHMWSHAAHITIAIYDWILNPHTSKTPEVIHKANIEAVTRSLQQFNHPIENGCNAWPSFAPDLLEILRRRCIAISNPTRMLFTRAKSGRLSNRGVDVFSVKLGDAWTRDLCNLGYHGGLSEPEIMTFLCEVTPGDYRKR